MKAKLKEVQNKLETKGEPLSFSWEKRRRGIVFYRGPETDLCNVMHRKLGRAAKFYGEKNKGIRKC